MKFPAAATDAGFRLLNQFHRAILWATRGRLGRRAFGMDVVELTTVGRTSGLARRTLLTVPVKDDDRFVLVASKGGNDRDPDWFRNLIANPAVTLSWGETSLACRARVATADEQEELWPRVISTYGPYSRYRRRSARKIPLVICETYE